MRSRSSSSSSKSSNSNSNSNGKGHPASYLGPPYTLDHQLPATSCRLPWASHLLPSTLDLHLPATFCRPPWSSIYPLRSAICLGPPSTLDLLLSTSFFLPPALYRGLVQDTSSAESKAWCAIFLHATLCTCVLGDGPPCARQGLTDSGSHACLGMDLHVQGKA